MADLSVRAPLDSRKAIPKLPRAPDVFQSAMDIAKIGTPVASGSKPTKRVGTPVVEPEMAKRRKKETPVTKKINAALAMEEWKAKYTKAFPNFVFHFELAADPSRIRPFRANIERLGGRIDSFFSKKCTHLIILRPIGSGAPPLSQKDTNRPLKPEEMFASGKSKVNPFWEPGPNGYTSSMAVKAEEMNIKVWPLAKLQEVLSLLCPADTVPPVRNQFLKLLEDEKVNGTRERDTHAPRNDHYYFAPGNHYILIEDALGQHRPVMAKEYERKTDEGRWPTLYTDFLRVPDAVKQADDGTLPDQQREKAIRMFVTRIGWKGEVAPVPSGPNDGLRRTHSVQSFNRQSSGRLSLGGPLPTPPPYQAASGNSVALTSNINSTCNSASRMSADNVSVPNKDKRVLQISKRVQVLKSNVSARIAAEKPKLGAANGLEGADDELEIFGRPRSASTVTEMKPDRRIKSQKEVLEILKMSRRPIPVPDYITRNDRIECRRRAFAPNKTLMADKSGYCENCRLKFDNIETHAECRRHLRFVAEPSNWTDLDESLRRVARLRRQTREECEELLDIVQWNSRTHVEASASPSGSEGGTEAEEE